MQQTRWNATHAGISEGYLSSTGKCFDIGEQPGQRFTGLEDTGEPFSGSANPNIAGNGSIMRLAPVSCSIFQIMMK